MNIDVVDAQIHLGPGEIASTLKAMDELGIRSVLIDEFWGRNAAGDARNFEPGFALPNGAWRVIAPLAQQASHLYPDRFSYLLRVDRRDPDLACVIRLAAALPNARAIRILPVWTLEEAGIFAKGGYDELCDLAEAFGLPLFLFVPGFVELLPRYLRKYPKLTCVVDHCGMGQPGIPAGRPQTDALRAVNPLYFDEVLKLAEHPNVALKWSHAQYKFSAASYPYEPIRPFLRRAIDAFGAERLLWASDKSVIPNHTWSNLLGYLRDDPELTLEEKEWILGRTARKILKWQDA